MNIMTVLTIMLQHSLVYNTKHQWREQIFSKYVCTLLVYFIGSDVNLLSIHIYSETVTSSGTKRLGMQAQQCIRAPQDWGPFWMTDSINNLCIIHINLLFVWHPAIHFMCCYILCQYKCCMTEMYLPIWPTKLNIYFFNFLTFYYPP